MQTLFVFALRISLPYGKGNNFSFFLILHFQKVIYPLSISLDWMACSWLLRLYVCCCLQITQFLLLN